MIFKSFRCKLRNIKGGAYSYVPKIFFKSSNRFRDAIDEITSEIGLRIVINTNFTNL